MTEKAIPDPASAGWHLDKRVPIILILGSLMQAGAFVWWGAKLDARVVQLESDRVQQVDQPSKIVRLETKMENVQDTLKDVNSKLDRLLERGAKP